MLDIINKTKEHSSLLTISSIGASLTLIILVLLSSFYKDIPLILTNVLLALTISLLTFIGYLFTVHNKKQNQELLMLSNKDELTGLRNKTLLHEKISETVEKHLRAKQKSCLLIIEIDNFQKINEQFSYQEGQQVLKNTADIIKDKLRITDQLYRFEGNKFAIMAFNTTLKGAGHLAEMLREHIQKTDTFGDKEITLSIGVAQISTLDDANSWLDRTDASLFGAHSTGGNSTFLAIPEERSLNYELEPFFSKDNQQDADNKEENIGNINVISFKSFRQKKLVDSETTL